MVFLDTNIVIGIMTRRLPGAVARFEAELALGTPLLIPAIVLYELEYGVRKSAFPERNARRLDEFMTAIREIVTFDPGDAAEAGAIRADLEQRGIPIGPNDVLIAAQARRRQAALVTANLREFHRVPGLIVMEWSD